MDDPQGAPAQGDIPFAGTLTLDDVRSAWRLYFGPSRTGKIGLGVFVGFLVFGLSVPVREGQSAVVALAPLAMLPLFALYFWWIYRRGARTAFESNRLLQGGQEGTVGLDGISFRSQYGASALPWGVFHRVRASNVHVLLYIASNQFHLLPRRYFASDADWLEFRRRALAHVPTKPPAQAGSTWKTLLLWVAIFIVLILLWAAFRSSG